MSLQNSKSNYEEPPEMSEDDEALLDKIWDKQATLSQKEIRRKEIEALEFKKRK